MFSFPKSWNMSSPLLTVLCLGITCQVGLIPVLSAQEWEGDITSQEGKKLSVAVEFPRVASLTTRLVAGTPRAVSFRVKVPPDGPKDVKAVAYLKDKDGLWYQTLTKGPFAPGRWEQVTFDLERGGGHVLPDDHFFQWNAYPSTKMEIVGLKFFSTLRYHGSIELTDSDIQTGPLPRTSLRVLDLRRNTDQVEVFDLFEISFTLSRSFTNPFDPEEIDVQGTFVSPAGKVHIIPGFYYRDFIRSQSKEGEILTPQGREEWKVRFTPLEPGTHGFYLSAKTGGEEVRSRRGSFEAVPSRRKGFVRICQTDRNWFEFTTGEFFYPIGHNVRSPTDPRCAKHVYGSEEPVDMGTFAYDGYLAKMAANGENLFEVWMSSWWAGLEWTKRWKTYYDVGHYSSENAWRLDHLVNLCEKLDMYTHLVIDNHGKASTWCDPEWKDNAYNVKNGGFLKSPEEFFSNERAKKSHKKKLRYIIARWGYSPRIMGFELWSEIDLTGQSSQSFKRHPVKREWHQEMIRYINQIDPWEHLCTTHYSGNYHVIDPEMAKMPEIDYIAVDAYRDKDSVIPYVLGTCEFGRRLGKPSFITEYGGTPWGFKSENKLARLEADLHTGIWSGFMSGLSGTPLLWWFDFIDREDLYYHYKALADFCKGEDLRNLALQATRVEVQGVDDNTVRALALTNEKRAYLWVYDEVVTRVMADEKEARGFEGITVAVPMEGEEYVIEFWDTYRGAIVKTFRAETEGGILLVSVPSFKRDIACKIVPASPPRVERQDLPSASRGDDHSTRRLMPGAPYEWAGEKRVASYPGCWQGFSVALTNNEEVAVTSP